jgi:hypothetical protein
VYRTEGDFARVATIPVGAAPHGIWPSGDGSRMYVGLENGSELVVIDTARNEVVARVGAGGQASQAVVYVPGAVPQGDGREHLVPREAAGGTVHLALGTGGTRRSTVAIFDQGLTQVLQVIAGGLEPGRQYVLALTTQSRADGLEPIARFSANPAGAAVIDAVGPIRQLARGTTTDAPVRQLVIAPTEGDGLGAPVQVQLATPGG